MSNITLNPNASGTGTFSISSPDSDTNRTLTLPDQDGELVNLDSSGDLSVQATSTVDFSTSGTERMRIDSSGNLLVGKTSTDAGATVGVEATSSGKTYFTRDTSSTTASVLDVNKKTGDGTIIAIRKDGSTMGSIGAQGNYLHIEGSTAGSYGLKFVGSSYIRPSKNVGSLSDNELDLGVSSARFDDIYATNGTIQTSDRNEKQDIEVLSEAEQRVAQACKGLLRKFRWIDSVAEKGDNARIHFGIIAQDLQDAFTAEGLDAGRYAMFISSTWWEATETYTDDDGVEQTRTNTYETQEEAPAGATERTRLGVRYPELLAFIIGAM